MGFNYNGINIKDKDYLKHDRKEFYTSIREDYYNDFKELYTKLNEPRTKALDILVELLYDDDILDKYVKRLKEY